MATSPDKNDKRSSHLKYAKTSANKLGEGNHNRPENVNVGADASRTAATATKRRACRLTKRWTAIR